MCSCSHKDYNFGGKYPFSFVADRIRSKVTMLLPKARWTSMDTLLLMKGCGRGYEGEREDEKLGEHMPRGSYEQLLDDSAIT